MHSFGDNAEAHTGSPSRPPCTCAASEPGPWLWRLDLHWTSRTQSPRGIVEGAGLTWFGMSQDDSTRERDWPLSRGYFGKWSKKWWMGKLIGREAVFAHLQSDCITQTTFQHSPLLLWTLVCRASKAPATGRGETAECVYLNHSIITRSNKHRTLGEDRFVISNPNVCTHVFRRIMLPSLKEKSTIQALKVWHII